jgi:hypothetical protein
MLYDWMYELSRPSAAIAGEAKMPGEASGNKWETKAKVGVSEEHRR